MSKQEKTILVVEDDQTTKELLRIRLEGEGYNVIAAINGIQGLERLMESKIDLIVLDIIMPKLDGCALVQEIKRMEDLKNIPIIVITARDNLQNFLIEEGVDEYFEKPIEIKSLLQKIEDLLGD